MAVEKVTLYEIDIDIDLAVKDTIKLKKEIENLKEVSEIAKRTQGELSEEYITYQAELKATQKELRVNEKLTQDAIAADRAADGSINQLRKDLSTTTVQWAKLSKEERENTEEGKKLVKQKLDLTEALKKEEKATGDTRRNVGNYAESILDAVDSLQKEQKELLKNKKALDGYADNTKLSEAEQEKLNKELVVTNKRLKETKDELENYGDTSEDVAAGTGDLSDGFGQLDDATGGTIGKVKGLVKQFLVLLANPIVAIVAGIVVAVTALTKAFGQSQEGADTFGQAFDAIGKSIDAIVGRLAGLASNIKGLITGKLSFDEFKKKASGTFKGIQKEIKDVVKESNKLFALKTGLEEATIAATTFVAELNLIAETQGAIADDATLSFQEREEAARLAEEALIEAREVEFELAEQALELFEAENDLKEKQGLLTRELRQEEADLVAASLAAESALEVTRLEQSKRRATLAQENFEQELDILLDIANASSMVNLKRIADEKITFSERVKILDETKILLNQSFDQQIALFEEENQLSLDRDALLQLNNEQIFTYLRGLELSEIETNRLREVIIDRKNAEQDLADAESDINDERIANEEAYFAATQKLADDAYQDDIDRLNQLQQDELIFLNNKQRAEQDNVFAILKIEKQKLAIQKEQEIANAEAIGADTSVIQEKYAKINKQIDLERYDAGLSIAGDFASNVATIFGEQSKVGKAAAIAAVVISTAQSAVAAFTGLAGIPIIGVPLGIAAAAAAVVAGGKQLQNIKNTNVDGVASGNAPGNSPTTTSTAPPSVGTGGGTITEGSGVEKPDVNADIGNGIVNRTVNQDRSTLDRNRTVLVIDDVENKQFSREENNQAALL
jgi:hypothetical protein